MPMNSPLCVPLHLKRARHPVALGDNLLDVLSPVGESPTKELRRVESSLMRICGSRWRGSSGWKGCPADRLRLAARRCQPGQNAGTDFELRPEALETEGLLAALNRQIDVLRAKQGFSAQPIAHAEPELAIEVKQALY